MSNVKVNSPCIGNALLKESSQRSDWICWDRDTVRKIGYVLTNARHYEPIEDPYLKVPDLALKKGWIDCDVFEDHVELVMYTSTKLKVSEIVNKTQNNKKPEKLHLEELNIVINYSDIIIEGKSLIKSTIVIPYINNYK